MILTVFNAFFTCFHVHRFVIYMRDVDVYDNDNNVEEGYLVPQERVRSESYLECEPDVRSFGLGSPIGFGYLSMSLIFK